MARPKKGVTPANINKVDNYFLRAFKYDRLHRDSWFASHDALYEAKESYKKLPAISSKSSEAKKTTLANRCVALQQWIDTYIPNEKWQRCLLTLRQEKSRKKLKLRQLNLGADIYSKVKVLAEKKGITMGEAIQKLAKPALN